MTPTPERIHPSSICASWQEGPTCCRDGIVTRSSTPRNQTMVPKSSPPRHCVGNCPALARPTLSPRGKQIEHSGSIARPYVRQPNGKRDVLCRAPHHRVTYRVDPSRCEPPQKKFETHGLHTHLTAHHRVGSFVSAPPPGPTLCGPRLTPPLRRGPLSCPDPPSRAERPPDPSSPNHRTRCVPARHHPLGPLTSGCAVKPSPQ